MVKGGRVFQQVVELNEFDDFSHSTVMILLMYDASNRIHPPYLRNRNS